MTERRISTIIDSNDAEIFYMNAQPNQEEAKMKNAKHQ